MSDRVVWVIGASTGIGKSVALEYARHREIGHVILSARSRDKLVDAQQSVEAVSCKGTVIQLDVTDPVSIEKAKRDLNDLGVVVDTIVYNAGTCEYMDSDRPDVDMAHRVMATNYFGAIALTKVALPLLRAAHGKLGFAKMVYVASSVTYQSLPRAHAYGASKAALRYFAECMKIDLQLEGVDVHVVSPGFVNTPMTEQNDFDMPFMIESSSAAQIIVKGIESGTFDISFPKRFTLMLKSIAQLPASLRFKLLGKMSRHDTRQADKSETSRGRKP